MHTHTLYILKGLICHHYDLLYTPQAKLFLSDLTYRKNNPSLQQATVQILLAKSEHGEKDTT